MEKLKKQIKGRIIFFMAVLVISGLPAIPVRAAISGAGADLVFPIQPVPVTGLFVAARQHRPFHHVSGCYVFLKKTAVVITKV